MIIFLHSNKNLYIDLTDDIQLHHIYSTLHTTITISQCVVALTDQWYLAYGDPEWADKVSQHIHSKEFNGYNDKIMESFDHVRTAHFCGVHNTIIDSMHNFNHGKGMS